MINTKTAQYNRFNCLFKLLIICCVNLGAGKDLVIQWARWDRIRISGLKSQIPRWLTWRLTFLGILSAILTPFLTGSLPMLGFWITKCASFFVSGLGSLIQGMLLWSPRWQPLVKSSRDLIGEFEPVGDQSENLLTQSIFSRSFFSSNQPDKLFPISFLPTNSRWIETICMDVNKYVYEKWKSPCHQIVSAQIHEQPKVGVWRSIQEEVTLRRDSVKKYSSQVPEIKDCLIQEKEK